MSLDTLCGLALKQGRSSEPIRYGLTPVLCAKNCDQGKPFACNQCGLDFYGKEAFEVLGKVSSTEKDRTYMRIGGLCDPKAVLSAHGTVEPWSLRNQYKRAQLIGNVERTSIARWKAAQILVKVKVKCWNESQKTASKHEFLGIPMRTSFGDIERIVELNFLLQSGNLKSEFISLLFANKLDFQEGKACFRNLGRR